MKERNLQAIVATVVSNSSIIDAMKHLSTSEQLGFAACLLGCDLKKDELPQIPDTEVAKKCYYHQHQSCKGQYRAQLRYQL